MLACGSVMVLRGRHCHLPRGGAKGKALCPVGLREACPQACLGLLLPTGAHLQVTSLTCRGNSRQSSSQKRSFLHRGKPPLHI